MRSLSEKEILSLAPNAAAVGNARKISAGGGFIRRMRSADDSFYMGECKGSGKSNYIVSGDYIDEDKPVYRCSCPSRQFPCKHSLALMFEIAAGKEFEPGEIPQDILDKRERKEAKEAKREQKKEQLANMSEEEKAAAASKSARASKAAKSKKIRKQLEGLEWMKKMTDQLLLSGLASMGSVSLKSYKDLSRQLGDYYLPGPQVLFNRLIIEIEEYHKDQDSRHYKRAVEALKRLRALEKKAKSYLEEKLENDRPEANEDILFEALGGIWKLEQLCALGLEKENASLIQLSFEEIYEEARKEYIDKAYWLDLESGEISYTANYRPLKALKYVKQEDSCFALLFVPKLCYYPGGLNRRIRWESARLAEIGEEELLKARRHAHQEIEAAVKAAKNELKNILSEDEAAMLIAYKRIVKGRDEKDREVFLAEDSKGQCIELRKEEGEETQNALRLIPYRELMEEQVLFGKVYYDRERGKICMKPCSILTERGIFRLEY